MRPLSRPLRSLRVRVLATALAVFAIGLAVAAFLAYQLLLQDGRRDADAVIAREQARFERSIGELLAEAQLDAPDEPIEALRGAVRRYLQLNPSTESYWTIVTFADGGRLAAANGPPALEPLFRDEDDDQLPTGQLNRRETLPTPAGEVRTVSVPVLVDAEQVAVLQVLAPLAPVREEALQAALLLAAVAGLALLVGAALLGVTLWRSLAPVGALVDAARSTELRTLHTRVDESDTDDEVGLLAREFNAMLDRLEAAAAQQRGFMVSAGHELRAPIAIARGHLELLQRVDRHDAAFDATLTVVGDELGRMSRIVEDLMAVARSDTKDFVRPREIELMQWFEDLELKIAGTDAAEEVTVFPPPPVVVWADPDRLAQAVLNLVTNAHVHTPEGTPVRVHAAAEADWLSLSVSDDGLGIPTGIRDDLFSPFTRAGDAPDSAGLGLAVVKAVIDAHGGAVKVRTGPSGTSVSLRLPWDGVAAGDHTDVRAPVRQDDTSSGDQLLT